MYSCTNEAADTPEVCFEREVLPIFTNSCNYSGCHNNIDKESGWDFSNYQGILRGVKPGNHRASSVYKVMVGVPIMPPSPYDRISQSDLITVATWIEQGAKYTTCPPAVCDTNDVRLSRDVKPIFQRYCGSCHMVNHPQGGIDLRIYEDVLNVAEDGSLVKSVKFLSTPDLNMPPGTRMPSCEIQVIEAWVNQGAKDN